MRTEIKVTVLTILLLISACLAEAWCNRKEQPGQAPQAENFELPEVTTSKPFRFDQPDPSRLLRELKYTLDPSQRTVFLVATSNRLSPQQAADVQAGILGLLSESMCHPEDVMVVWGADVRRIATFRNDERVRGCGSSNTVRFKIHENRAEIARLNQHFQAIKEAGHSGRASLNVPHLGHHLGQEFHEYPDFPNRVLIFFGSAIDVFEGGRTSELEGAYPTIGMLRAPLSPLSTRDKAWYLGNTVTHFVYTDRITDRVHRDGLQNFWAGFFLSQGSPLLTFSADPKISERALNARLPSIAAYVDDVNPAYISVRPVSLFDEDVGSRGGRVTSLERGSLSVGLKWEAEGVDLDLHVGLRGQGERLSFRQAQTVFGSLTKQYSTGWEVASLNSEVRPEDVELWANFYRGSAPPEGVRAELRISYAGSVFSRSVRFTATRGNEGKAGSPGHWQYVTLADLLSEAK